MWGGYENMRLEDRHPVFDDNFNVSGLHFSFGDIFRTVGVGKLSTRIDEV